MGESGPERMKEYEKRLGSAEIPTTHISGFGRFSIPGLGEGQISGSGHISPEEIKVSGSSRLPGGLKVGSIITSGTTTIGGDIEADSINFSGSTTIHGSLTFGRLKGSGSLRAEGPAKGGAMHVSGSCKIGGEIVIEDAFVSSGSLEASGDVVAEGSAELDGVFEVDGKLKTRRLEASLSRDRSRVERGIEANYVDIRKGGRYERVPRFAARLFGLDDREGNLYTTVIIGGSEVHLENVICDEVSGAKVMIGEGCDIRGTVRYAEAIEVHPEARVRNPPEKADSLDKAA
jgi:cytoskeletal protein CcmA (bactofilin family)